MELLNFKIGDDFISVTTGDLYLDLHNNFDFTGYDYDVAGKEIELIFKKAIGDWVPDHAPGRLKFRFMNVNFLKFKEKDQTSFPHDQKCLSEIAFSHRDERDNMDFFTDQYNEEVDMIFLLQSGYGIKIHAEKVRLEIN